MVKSYYNIVETLVNIVSADDGYIKILLKRKENEPYKGYWMLPEDILSNEQTLESSSENIVFNSTNFPSMFLIQGKVFSDLDRDAQERIIACSYISLTVKDFVKVRDMKWFNVNDLPKMAYDHEKITMDNMKLLKKMIISNDENILFKLFPNDFTLGELQKFFENVLGRQLDRRNFRKKLINDNIVIETGEKVTTAGRPSKLYMFNKGGWTNE